MRADSIKTFVDYMEPPEDMLVWQWAAKHVDYSLEQSYDSESTSKYDPEFIPLWKEVAECLTDPMIRHIVIRKCSRAGGTETILNGLRYFVAEDPGPILYVGAQQTTMRDFFEERIVRGMKVAQKCRDKLDLAKISGTNIHFSDCTITSSYFGSESGAKQKGFRIVVLDEFSTSKAFAGDAFKKRIDNYRTGKVIMISSLDHKKKEQCKDDPLNLEYIAGDQREWHIKDSDGKLFIPEMGLGYKPLDHGIKWDETARTEKGEWILKRVEESAHYLTPCGEKLSNEEFQDRVDQGVWVPGNEELAAPKTRSYTVDGHLLPFEGGDLGTIAVGWIEAQRKGKPSERIWIYENQPNHEYHEEVAGQIELQRVYDIRDAHPYDEHTIPTSDPVILVLLADVQKQYIEYAVWALGEKDNYLITNATCSVLEDLPMFSDVNRDMKKDERGYYPYYDLNGKGYACSLEGIDSGYRTTEVYKYCRSRKKAMALKGDTGKMSKPITSHRLDYYPSGKPMRGGVILYHLHRTQFRDEFVWALNGYADIDPDIAQAQINLHFHRNVGENFAKQVTAETKDDDGVYRSHGKNEQFDLGHYAFAMRYYLRGDIQRLKAKKASQPKQEEPEPKPVTVEKESDGWGNDWY